MTSDKNDPVHYYNTQHDSCWTKQKGKVQVEQCCAEDKKGSSPGDWTN